MTAVDVRTAIVEQPWEDEQREPGLHDEHPGVEPVPGRASRPWVRYVVRRVLQAVGVLVAAYTVSFFVLYRLPGDPVTILAGGGTGEQLDVDPAKLAELKAEYGFDQPVWLQYLTRLGAAVQGDFGRSVQTGEPVTAVLLRSLPSTLQLSTAALLVSVIGGAALAVVATWTRNRWLRDVLLALPPLAVSLPTFWIGLVLVDLLSFRLRLFPAMGDGTVATLVLPVLTLAIPGGAVVAQLLAKSLLRTLDEPYIDIARAKGLTRGRIHLAHALRNAALPAFTATGMMVGNLFAGSVVVETVFGRNGVGRVTQQAVTLQDIPVVQGVVALGALVFVTVNLVVDLVYPLLDPRIVTAAKD